jgi:hypothetical protein
MQVSKGASVQLYLKAFGLQPLCAIAFLFVSFLAKRAFYAVHTNPTKSVLLIAHSRSASFFFDTKSCFDLDV